MSKKKGKGSDLLDQDCTEFSIEDLASQVMSDSSFTTDARRLYVARHYRRGSTAAEAIKLAEDYAADRLAKRKAGDPQPDDPGALYEIAAKVEADMLADGAEPADAKRSREYRERKADEAIARKLANEIGSLRS